MKTNTLKSFMLAVSLLFGACDKADDSSIQLAGTTWCAQLSDNKHDYQYQLEFLKNKRVKTSMQGRIRSDAPTNESVPHEMGGTGEYSYEVMPQPIDASDVTIVISNAEAGFSDRLSYYRETTNDGSARIVQGDRVYYQSRCSF